MFGTTRSDVALQREALRLISLIIPDLHADPVEGGRIRLTVEVSGEVADDLSAFGAFGEDDEDDGTAELDARRSPPTLEALEALLTFIPREGHPVPAWSPPGQAMPEPATAAVARLWPDLVQQPPEAV